MKEGKIFYNRNGRQIGSGDFLEKKSIVLLPDMAGEETALGKVNILFTHLTYSSGVWLPDQYISDYNKLSWSGNLVAVDANILLGFSINGHQCNYAFNMSDPDKIEGYEAFGLHLSDYEDNEIFEFYLHNGNLYLNLLSEGYTLEVFYA